MRYLSSNNEYQGLSSRYQTLRVVENEGQTYLETYNQVKIPESSSDSYHIVGHDEINRLDIISNLYYGTPTFWWAIALANGMIDPFLVSEGVMLRVPSRLTLNNVQYRIL